MWLPPDLAKPLVKIATDEVQPIGVIIEKIPDLGRGET